MKIASVAALAFLMVTPIAQAQTHNWAVMITMGGTSRMGKQLLYRVKEEIRKSSTLGLVDDQDETKIRVRLTTLPDDPNDNVATVLTYAITMEIEDPLSHRWVLWHSNVGVVGRDAIQSAAADLIVVIADKADSGMKEREAWDKGDNEYLKDLCKHPRQE